MNEDLIVLPRRHGAGYHYVLVGTTGATCTCPGYEYRRKCYAIELAKEIVRMTREVTTYQPPAGAVSVLPSRQELESIDWISARLIESGAVAVPESLRNNMPAVRAVIMAGVELGVQPMTALRHMSVINGKPEPDAQLMVAIAMGVERDILFEIVEEDAEKTLARLTRPSKGLVKETPYTNQMARDAGLWKNAWVHHSTVMRQWACFKRLARGYCMDLINGVHRVVLDAEPATYLQAAPEELVRPAGVMPPPEDPEDEGDGADLSEEDEGDEEDEEDEEEDDDDDDEGVEDVPTTTPEQAATIRDYREEIAARHGLPALDRVIAGAKERWPYAGDDDGFKPLLLTETDAAALIAYLKGALGARDGTPPAAAGML